jgi:hypothetical protein
VCVPHCSSAWTALLVAAQLCVCLCVSHCAHLGLASGFRAAGGALCAAQPNRFFCNNPACRSAAGASAGFGLVRGEGVVFGGCLGLARGEAVPEGWVAARYCSVACQQQHFACHKACYHDAVWGDAHELTSRVLQAAADAQRIPTAHSFCSCCSGASPGNASVGGGAEPAVPS